MTDYEVGFWRSAWNLGNEIYLNPVLVGKDMIMSLP